MGRLRTFIKTTTLGGLIVVLPAVLLIVIFRGLFNWLTDMIQPLTNLLMEVGKFRELIADGIALILIFGACFLIGVMVRTKVGRFFHESLEEHILSVAPGYRTIRETIIQVMGRERPPFSSVALVRLYNNDTLMTAFVTDEHPSGWLTVFIPTGPNPTTGYITHLRPEQVHKVDVRANDAIRSVISCGAGSSSLFEEFWNRTRE